MFRQNKGKKHKILTYITVALIFCTLLTSCFSAYVLARHITSDNAEGTLNINSYDVSVVLQEPGTSQNEITKFNVSAATVASTGAVCNVYISNQSGLTVNYTVTVTNETRNLPLYFSFDNGTNSILTTAATTAELASSGETTIVVTITIPSNTEYNTLYREIDQVSLLIECVQAVDNG